MGMTMKGLLDPYVCDYELCPNFQIALEGGMTDDEAAGICCSAMKRIIGGDPERSVTAAMNGVECGLFLAQVENNQQKAE